ncbi:MAG: lysoplasmalogenase, partial [Desulfosarcina sp.]
MDVLAILSLAAALLIGLLNAEKSQNPTRVLIFKTPLSLLFIVAWTLRTAPPTAFALMVLIALLFCLGGDILLAFGSRSTFLFGLVSFLLGHLMYAAAFFSAGEVGPVMAVGMLLMMAAAIFIWRWLEPHLGNMQIPVLAYIAVISIMVCGACGVAGNSSIPASARGSILTGAMLFYMSDLFVARQRFVSAAHINRTAGLPLYYA